MYCALGPAALMGLHSGMVLYSSIICRMTTGSQDILVQPGLVRGHGIFISYWGDGGGAGKPGLGLYSLGQGWQAGSVPHSHLTPE